MINKTILIAGANAGIGKEVARQLAFLNDTEKIYLACRNKSKQSTIKNSAFTLDQNFRPLMGEVRDAKWISYSGGKKNFIIAENNDHLIFLRPN